MIRRAVPADAPACVQIAGSSPEATAWSQETYQRLDQTGYLAWVAVIAGEAVGFLVGRAMADEAEILNVVVGSGHRRKGCATALIREAVGKFRAQGARRVLLEVRESNLSAIRFYEWCGFLPIGRRPDYYEDPPEAALCMALDLDKSLAP